MQGPVSVGMESRTARPSGIPGRCPGIPVGRQRAPCISQHPSVVGETGQNRTSEVDDHVVQYPSH